MFCYNFVNLVIATYIKKWYNYLDKVHEKNGKYICCALEITISNQYNMKEAIYMDTKLRIPIPAVDFQPPVYVCKRATKPFTLDGNIDKEFWEDAPYTPLFLDIEGDHMPTPRFETKAKMLWDDTNFYFAALLEGDEIWANITERDAVIFYDNDFEIFIDPDSDTQQYYEFEMNALNTVWDLLLTKAYRDLGKPVNGYDMHGLQTAVHINGSLNDPSATNQSWSVEVVIPFSAISECALENRSPKDGEYYRVNFSRVQWLTDVVDQTYKKRLHPTTNLPLPEDNWVWAPTGVINIHYPELWSFVFFSDGAKPDCEYQIPEDEKIKWELRKLYYAEQAYYDEHGHYTDQIDKLLEQLRNHSPIEANRTVLPYDYTLETTSHSFEISCSSYDKQHILTIFSDGKTSLFPRKGETL